MTTWGDFEHEAPELAGRVQARFDDTGLALVATLRADGSPRISGWEPLFADGQLWLGSMPESRKLADVRRDPRLTLHNATADKNVAQGDATISGRAVEVTDEDTKRDFMDVPSRRPPTRRCPPRSTCSGSNPSGCRC